MNRVRSGSAVPRHLVFVLEDGSFVVQWDNARVQDLLSGEYRKFHFTDFGHPITEYELKQLKAAGLVEYYDRAFVWLFALPEPNRFERELKTQEQPKQTRIRAYYLNTTLPHTYTDKVRVLIADIGLADTYEAHSYNDLVAVTGRDGSPFTFLNDAEEAQRRLQAKAMEIFKDSAVAFVEMSSKNGRGGRTAALTSEPFDLETLIASQTDTSATQGKLAVLAIAQEDDLEEFRRLLAQMKLKVKAAATAWDALRCLEDHVPDILITDMLLPDMHVWVMLEKIREISSLRQLPTVVIAESNVSPGDQTFGLTVAKVDAFLIKPISTGRLRQNVWTVLKRQQPPTES